ncbi:MAG TPA: non-homologous end-joining DNA ligase [Longimicrobiaceae bacterium]|nr:non-homologous end-joining DNA ligase [Longimicrobiaceae bacterium]
MPRPKSETTIAGVRLTHPDRVLYPEQGVTKRELAEYYAAVAEHLLPYVRNRLVTLIRCPGGREGECFVQRRAGAGLPDAVRRVEVADEEGERATYLTVSSVRELVALVQVGTLELHAWGARLDRLDRPDRMILDLDPGPGLPFSAVVEGAKELHARLDGLGLVSFVKTTGGKGLHVTVPLVRRSAWEEVRSFARALAEEMERRHPDRFVAEAAKAERTGRIYVDYLRNGFAASAVVPFSTRARSGAPVSVPLSWDELTPSLDPSRFTVRTVPERLARQRTDPWAGYSRTRQALTKRVRSRVGRD